MQKVKIKQILKRKGKIPIVCLTAYSKPLGEILDNYCDIILVGDSVGMSLYGMKTTKEVKMQTMILHAQAVKRSVRKSLLVFDMPFKTYSNKIIAYKNAKKILKMTKCDAVKLEGGRENARTIKYLTNKGIPVMGHIGLLPQSSKNFKLQGKNLIQKRKILDDALQISNAGAFAIVIECVVESLAKEITKSISIPTIGIGASKYCDGQILVIDDMIGLSNMQPRFVKKYSNTKKNIEKAVRKYSRDVKKRKFPFSQNVYKQ
tara:strand:+ start:1434 stop:2216 length:783 start_codon:yes stop_codon:yes gene_type:complete